MAHSAGIYVMIYLIVGFPGENEEDIDQTIAWLEENSDYIDEVRSLNGLLILDDSALARHPERWGIELAPRTAPGFEARWVAQDNTPEIRVARIDRVRAALERLGIPLEFTNREEVLPPKLFMAEKISRVESQLDGYTKRLSGINAKLDHLMETGPRPIRPGYSDAMLIIPPVWGREMPPLGAAYIASFLSQQGYDPLVWDLNAYLYRNVDDELRTLWQENNFRNWTDQDRFPEVLRLIGGHIQSAVDRIIGTGRRIICFSTYSPNRRVAIEMARRIKAKAPDRFIIAGGRGLTTENERLLFPPGIFDALVVGEGETTIVPLLEKIHEGAQLAGIPGVAVPGGEAWAGLVPRELCQDLSLLPFPTYAEFDLEMYGEPGQEPELPLLFSRSCVKRCAFCNDHTVMGRFRSRPAEHMLAEINYHVVHNGRRRFRFNDQLINGDLKALEAFCDLIIQNSMEIEWIALAAARRDMSQALFDKMKAAGCFTLNFGIESGSDRILKAMNKGFTVADAAQSVERAFKAGINTMLNFIVGYPGETEEDFHATIRFLHENRPNICGVTSVNSLILLEGSPLQEQVEQYGIVLPEKNSDLEWFIPEVNTPEMRRERAERLVQEIHELDLHFLVSNLEERIDDPSRLQSQDAPVVEEPGESEPAPDEVECVSEEPVSPGMRPGEEDISRRRRGQPTYESIDKGPFDILLVLPPVWGVGVAPLGIAYLEQALTDAGIRVSCLDMNIKLYNRTHAPGLWTMESYKAWTDPEQWPKTMESMSELFEHYLSEMLSVDSQFIGLSTFTSNVEVSFELARRIKERQPHRKIIFGGPGMSNSYEPNRVNPEMGDYIVFGEADEILVPLVRALLDGRDVGREIEGVRKAGDTADVLEIERPIVEKPAVLNFPRFNTIRLEEYASRSVPLLASRGCIRKCAFCNDHHIYRKFRWRPAEDVFSEIAFHYERGFTEFTFNDVLINGNVRELRKLCRMIADAGLDVRWGGQGVIRKEMNLETLQIMRRAGCMSMVYGVESFSDKVLKLMNKPYDQEMCIKVLGATRQAGVEAIINLIVGFPGETEKEFHETYDFLINHRDLIDQVASISPCLVNLGAPLQRDFKKYGIVFPKEEPSIKWYTEDGENTYDERRRRLLRIHNLIADWDKSIHTINLYDDDRDNLEQIEALEGIHKEEPINKRRSGKVKPEMIISMAPPWGVEFPPLGLATLATSAREAGHRVEAFDLNIAMYDESDEKHKTWWELAHLKFWEEPDHLDEILTHTRPVLDSFIKKVSSGAYPLLGLTVHAGNFSLSMRLMENIKHLNPSIKIIAGGPGVYLSLIHI